MGGVYGNAPTGRVLTSALRLWVESFALSSQPISFSDEPWAAAEKQQQEHQPGYGMRLT